MRKILLLVISIFLAITVIGQTPEDYLNSGNKKYANNDYSGAMVDYTKAIALKPRYMFAYFNRGLCKVNLEKDREAILEFSMAIALDPKYSNAYSERGNAKRRLKDYEGAMNDLNKAINLDPKKASYYIERGVVWYLQKEYQKGISDYTKAIVLEPKNTYYYLGRGQIKAVIKDYSGALADYNKAQAIDPKNLVLFQNRGTLKLQLKEFAGALEQFNRAIGIDPTNAASYTYRGNVYFLTGKYSESADDFTMAISLDKNDGSSYINIMEPLARLHRFDEAVDYYEKFVSLGLKATSDSSWAFIMKFVEALTEGVSKGKYETALKNLQEAEKLYNDQQEKDDQFKNSSLSTVYTLTGYVLEKLNRITEARDVYKQSLLIYAIQPDVQQSLAALEIKLSEMANEDRMPPTINIISPNPSRSFDIESDNDKTQIIGRAKDASGIAEIKINGEPIDKIEEDGLFIAEIILKPGRNEINISATDKQGNAGEKNFMINSSLVIKKKEETDIPRLSEHPPKYYAILIAEKDYQDNSIPDLQNPLKDARDLKSILETDYTFDAENIDTLYNRSREDIMQTIVQRCNTLTQNDNLLIFYAGHGTAEKDQFGDVDGYWIPVSAQKGLTSTYISANDINISLKRSKAKHILLVADACFSGAFTRSIQSDVSIAILKQYKVNSRKVMASGNLEPVPDNSKFLFYLKKSLMENKEKYVSAKDLFDSFYKSIINNTDNLPQYAAIKNVGDEGGEFVFIKK